MNQYYFRQSFIEKQIIPLEDLFNPWKLAVTALVGLLAFAILWYLKKRELNFAIHRPSHRKPANTIYLLILLAFFLRIYQLSKEPINYLEWWTLQTANIFPEWWQLLLSKSGIASGKQFSYSFFLYKKTIPSRKSLAIWFDKGRIVFDAGTGSKRYRETTGRKLIVV